jgi:hypothetical protein
METLSLVQTDELVETVKRWIMIESKLKAINKTVKQLREEKKIQNSQMLSIMKNNNIDIFDIKNGQIQYKKQKKREQLTQTRLLEILTKHPELNEEQALSLNNFIFENRITTEKDTIVQKTFGELDT